MPEVCDILNISQLRSMQTISPPPLIVLYLGMTGVAQGTYEYVV